MTRREKLRATLTDDQLWDHICAENVNCRKCPILEICKKVAYREEFKSWLDEEVEE